ncbi:MAG TPA: signal peptidase I [Desulfotomaculum sp.]|nr:MAG: Signal peptidase I [Desulfotomaculum sp. 46_80]HAG10944.1 signal peptidase I [Desulfotomaculum sp.]HBY03950.1 signal peptidase I [Desulfotomaculum sp.]
MDKKKDKPAGQGSAEGSKKPVIPEILESIIIAVILATIIRLFLLAPFFIPSQSMEPALLVGDRIIVSKIAYRLGEPQRGDIIVFKYPRDPRKDYIKRLIGFEGEQVTLKNNRLYINGKETPEKYLPEDLSFYDFGPVTVPNGCYLMLGDNRPNSEDSRVWGALPKENVIGKAVLIYWPFNRARLL